MKAATGSGWHVSQLMCKWLNFVHLCGCLHMINFKNFIYLVQLTSIDGVSVNRRRFTLPLSKHKIKINSWKLYDFYHIINFLAHFPITNNTKWRHLSREIHASKKQLRKCCLAKSCNKIFRSLNFNSSLRSPCSN